MSKLVASVSGITGQTGSYLAEELLNRGFKVFGMIRKNSSFNTERLDHIFNNKNLELMYGDLTDQTSINNLIIKSKPQYFFHLGALSHVRASFDLQEFVHNVNALGTLRVMQAIKEHCPTAKVLHAATSELFGNEPPNQDEFSKMMPRSPYGISKLSAFHTVKNYREAYNLFAINAISFNHESPRRNPTFLTRKVTQTACRIKLGLRDELVLGNLESQRSFNHVKDIISGMMLMIEANDPDDYVIGDNAMISIKDFVEKVFTKLDLDWKQYIKFSDKYTRLTEVNALQPNSTKIKTKLGWQPQYTLDMLIDEMISHDLEQAKKEKLLRDMK